MGKINEICKEGEKTTVMVGKVKEEDEKGKWKRLRKTKKKGDETEVKKKGGREERRRNKNKIMML